MPLRTIDAYQGVRVLDSRRTASLLSQVLWITTVGFVFTALGAYIAPAQMIGGSMLPFLLSLGLIFAINATRRSPMLSLALFYVFTLVMGVEIGPIIGYYMHFANGPSVVFEAAVTTAVGLGSLGIVAQFARFDYRRVGGMATIALLGLVVIGILGAFFHFVNPGLYAWATLGIFSVLILVDFMRLRDGGQGLSPVQLSLSIYLDALNVFLALLQIFGGGQRRRD
jgi:FtsH-binding integral membrane protein